MSGKTPNRSFPLFFKANLLLTVVIFLLFLQYNNNYQVVDFLLALMGAISSAAIIYALLYVLLFIFRFAGRFGLYFSAFVFILINMALLIDFFIYKLFKFHINGMVINILTSPDAVDSIQTGITPVITFLIVIIAFILFEAYLIKKIIKTDNPFKLRLNRNLNKLIILPLIFIVLSEKVMYGFSSLTSNTAILSKFNVIPLYQPLTFNRMAAKYFNYKPKVKTSNTIQLNANISYPLKPIGIVDHPRKVNIFIFAFDSVKSTIINQETAPNLHAFKQESIILNNHHTGGNSTRFGIYSLIYGLNASYWFPFADAKKGAVLFDVLKQLNYQINITSATNTNWPEFKNTCYIQVQESIKDDFKGQPWEKDKQASAYFNHWLEQQDIEKPLFSFLFFDAPHGYSYPEAVNPFHANNKKPNYLTLKADSDEIDTVKKQYKNAVFYDDKLWGNMIDKLKEKGLYNDALIIFTSDHGQEFFEFGNFGHNTNFSAAQTQVPMMVKLPDFMRKEIELPNNLSENILNTLSSHQDVVPTLLSLIGVKNKPADYSNGKNIFSKNYSREYVISSNWTKNAIITNDRIYVFSNTPDKIFSNEIRDSKTYQPILDASNDSKIVIQVLNENKQFLK